MHIDAHMPGPASRGQRTTQTVGLILPPCAYWGMNSSHQTLAASTFIPANPLTLSVKSDNQSQAFLYTLPYKAQVHRGFVP